MDYAKRGLRITSWVLTALVTLFFLNDAYGMGMQTTMAKTNIADVLGIPYDRMPLIALTCLACLALYLVPRTSRLGVVLLTGYLGGAAAVNLVLSPDPVEGVFGFATAAVVGIAAWAPLWIRDAWLRGVFGHPVAHEMRRGRRVGGRILTALLALFLLFDVAIHLFSEKHAVASAKEMGIDPAMLPVIGGIELACLLLYLTPRTARFGAVLMTAYLGGASAVNLVTGQPTFNVVFAPLLAVALWGAVWLRDAWVHDMLASSARPAAAKAAGTVA